MRKLLTAIVLVVGMMNLAAGAEELQESNPAKVAGYYHNEGADIIMLANGTAYSLEEGTESLLEGPIDYSVLCSGNDFILERKKSYSYFQLQEENGKTENGGHYYAVYTEYIGDVDEVGFKEGKQVNFEGYIFDNDYEVYERDSLMSFFGESVGSMGSGKMEGEGFDTPEQALETYIEGLKNNDVDQMIAAFAVETYVENYSLTKMVERLQSYQPVIGYIPSISDYSVRLNIEKRRSDITNAIRNQYLVLQGSKTVLGDNAYTSITMKDTYETAQELVDDLFVSDDTSILDSIEFKGEFISPSALSDLYDSENNQEIMKKQLAPFAGEDITSVAARFYCDGYPVLITADAIMYNGRWYLNSMSGNIGSLMGISSYLQGIIPLKYDEDGYFAELIGE